MGISKQIGDAASGWVALIAGRDTWTGKFRSDADGLAVALAFYLCAVLATTLAPVLFLGIVPNVSDVFFSVAANCLPLLAIWAVIRLTIGALRLNVTTLALLVPATYALAFLRILRLPLSMTALPYSAALLLILAYMLYREGRAIGGMSIPVSIAFSVLCVVVLVALPITLYMVLAPNPGGQI